MKLFVLIATLAAVSACGTYRLYDVSDNKALGGVPFYTLEQYNMLTSVYDQTFYKLEVTAQMKPHVGKGKAGQTVTRTVTAYDKDEKDVVDIYANYTNATNLAKAWAATGDIITGRLHAGDLKMSLAPFPPLDNAAALLQGKVIATSKTRVQVPSTTPIYYNINVPKGGQGSGEIDINTDGTLGKGLSSKQDTLPGTIATAAATLGAAALGTPLAQIFSHFFPAPTAPAAATAAPAPATTNGLEGYDIVNVDLKVTPIERVYTLALSQKAAEPKGCDDWKKNTTTLESTETCWATVAMAIKGPGTPEGKDANSITFNGSITVPPAPKPTGK